MAHSGGADLMDHFSTLGDGLASIQLHIALRLSTQSVDDLQEGLHHMRGLVGLALTPLPVEPQDRDAPLVLRRRIKFTITIVVWDHLAAAVKIDGRTIAVSELGAQVVADAGVIVPKQTRHAHRRHAAPPADLNV